MRTWKVLFFSCWIFLFHSQAFVRNLETPASVLSSFGWELSHTSDRGTTKYGMPDTPYQGHYHRLPFGTATFSATPDLWYLIETHSYPEPTLLSMKRNRGVADGRVYPSPTGFTIGEKGNYWVNITAILQNPTPDSSVLIPVYLAQNEEINVDDVSPIGGVAVIKTDEIITITGAGTLKDVEEGTRLSLVATNAGYPDPVPLRVVSWSISLFKLQ